MRRPNLTNTAWKFNSGINSNNDNAQKRYLKINTFVFDFYSPVTNRDKKNRERRYRKKRSGGKTIQVGRIDGYFSS